MATSDATEATGPVKKWLGEIEAANVSEKIWRETRAPAVVERYRDEKRSNVAEHGHPFRAARKFNILWANTEVLEPALYSQTPVPDVRTRHRPDPDDQQAVARDAIAKKAALALERSIAFSADFGEFDGVMSQIVKDYLLVGRGVPWEVYKPIFGTGEPVRQGITLLEAGDGFDERGSIIRTPARFFDPNGNEIPGDQVERDGEDFFRMVPADEVMLSEDTVTEYVDWNDYRQHNAPTWKRTRWVARRHWMTRAQLVDQFKDLGKKVVLTENKETHGEVNTDKEAKQTIRQAEVWEIWNKPGREVIFVSPGLKDRVLAKRPDPLRLKGFFPCPKPIRSVVTNETQRPIPEFTLYQDQADELDLVTGRIHRVMKALAVRGVYDASLASFEELFRGEENRLIPEENYSALAAAGGLEGSIAWLPTDPMVSVLQQLYTQRQALLDTIFQVTGISDIIRGSTDPRETLGAQELKGRFGSLRMKNRQKEIQRLARDLYRIKAEIIAEHFSPETIQEMSQMTLDDQVIEVLKSDITRRFLIDIETDSTVLADELRDKEDVSEYLNGLSGFMAVIGPMVEAGQLPVEAARAMLKWASKPFKVSREIEDQLEELGANQDRRPPSDAELKRETDQNKLQLDRDKLDLEQQKFEFEREKFAREMSLKQTEVANERAADANRTIIERDKIRAADNNAARQLEVSQAQKQVSIDGESIAGVAETVGEITERGTEALQAAIEAMQLAAQAIAESTAVLASTIRRMTGARRLVLDEDGNPVGTEPVEDDAELVN